jgi:hypothetical protein
MSDDLLHLTLLRAQEDPLTFSPEYQAELQAVYERLQANGLAVSARPFISGAAGCGGGLVGEFLIPLAQLGAPLISAVGAVKDWMASCAGRQLRLTVGTVELEARSPADLERILQKALELKGAQDRQPLGT